MLALRFLIPRSAQIQIKITLAIDPATGIDINFSSLLTLQGNQCEAITADIAAEKDRKEAPALEIETLTNKSSVTFLPSNLDFLFARVSPATAMLQTLGEFFFKEICRREKQIQVRSSLQMMQECTFKRI